MNTSTSLNTKMSEEPAAIASTRAWVDHAVIGLNLCPFARGVQVKGQVRYVLSEAQDDEALLKDLCRELLHLADTDPAETDTTLIVHPQVLNDFDAYNDFLDLAEAALVSLGLEGTLQIASFHPDYRFAGSALDDIDNATNRSPYPTLHILREDSIDRAVEAFPEAEAIYEHNIETLQRLGPEGWADLQTRWLGTGDAPAKDT